MSAYDEPQLPKECYGKKYNDNTKYCHDCCTFRDLCLNKAIINKLQQKLEKIK